jgi:ATP-binding cassette, subfamily B, bacterial
MALGSVLQMAFPILTQSLVDVGIGERNLSFITLILIAQLFLFVSQLAVGYIRSWIMLHINTRVDVALISDFLTKLMKLPLSYFDTKMTGDIMQRIGDHSRIKSLLMSNSFNIIFSIFNFFLFAGILAYYHPMILGIFLLGNGLYAIWVLSFMRYRRELDIKRFNQSAGEQSKLIQLVQGMQEIKLNNCEKQKRWEWERIQAKLFKISIRGLKLSQIQQTGSVFFTQTTQIIISFIAAKAVVDGQMTLGMMMSMTYILGQVSAPISEFIGFFQSLQDAQISLERLNEIHNQKDEDQNSEALLHELPTCHDIHLDHIRFSYSGAERDYALDDVSLTIPQGKVTAVLVFNKLDRCSLHKPPKWHKAHCLKEICPIS